MNRVKKLLAEGYVITKHTELDVGYYISFNNGDIVYITKHELKELQDDRRTNN